MAYTRQQIYQMEDQLEQVVNQLDAYNYYQLLGVDPQATKELIEFTFNQRVQEYDEIRGLKICPAALYQSLGKLLERLEEARRVLMDDGARAEYHEWLRAGHTRHFGQQAVKPREVEKKDAFLEAAARHLERQVGNRYTHAAEEDFDHGGTWSIDLGGGESFEGKDLAEVQEHLRRDMDRLGVYDEVGEEDQSASLDAEYLAETQEGLRRELDGYGVHDEVGEEASSASLDVDYLDEAEAHLRKQLKRDGVKDEAPPEAVAASLDMDYIEAAEQHLRAELASEKAPGRDAMTPRERAMALRREAFRASQTGEQPRLPPGVERRKRTSGAAAGPRPGAPRPAAPRPGAPRPGAPHLGAPRPGAPHLGAPRPAATRPAATPPGAPRPGAPRPGAPRPAATPPGAPRPAVAPSAAPPVAPLRQTGPQPAQRPPVRTARPPQRPAPAPPAVDEAPIGVIELDED